jgi:hypothetical protein
VASVHSISRPFVSDYFVPNVKKKVRIKLGVPEDREMIVSFLNKVVCEREPMSVSIGKQLNSIVLNDMCLGVTEAEMRPFAETITDNAIQDDLAILVFSEDELVGATVGYRAKVDRAMTVKAQIRKDYKEGSFFGKIFRQSNRF